MQNDNTNGAIGWCLDPTDLAIAKHIAGRQKDIQFTAAMAHHGMINESAFVERLETVDIPSDQREQVLRHFAAQTGTAHG